MKIYGLRDPRKQEIRYVGYTSGTLSSRLAAHVYGARRGFRSHRFCWIRSLLAEDIQPEMVLLEENPTSGWEAAERAWIAKLRAEGHRLTNATEGGDVGSRGTTWKLTEETKAKMRKPKSAETRMRMSAARKRQKPMSDATKAKIRAARLGQPSPRKGLPGLAGTANPMYGRTHTAEARAKIGAARKAKGATWLGGKHTPDAKARISEQARNRSPETRAKLSAAARRRKPMSPEVRAKIAATMRRRHAERKATLS